MLAIPESCSVNTSYTYLVIFLRWFFCWIFFGWILNWQKRCHLLIYLNLRTSTCPEKGEMPALESTVLRMGLGSRAGKLARAQRRTWDRRALYSALKVDRT